MFVISSIVIAGALAPWVSAPAGPADLGALAHVTAAPTAAPLTAAAATAPSTAAAETPVALLATQNDEPDGRPLQDSSVIPS